MSVYPNSSLLTSVYIPDFFEPTRVSSLDGSIVKDTNFTFERDATGKDSIIRLNKIPFIDISKYDNQRRKWFWTDKYDGLWRYYGRGEWIIETNSFNGTGRSSRNQMISMEGMEQGEKHSIQVIRGRGYDPYQYKPIKISVNGVELTDISDYSGGQTVIPQLDNVNPDRNKEFYYDFRNSIYTNQDFSLYKDDDILIEFTINIDNITVNCRMDTNITNLSPYTPTVDYYIVKLTGQNL